MRNFLRAEAASFLGLCEYTDRGDAARARSYFFDRRKDLLLYTERAQFYGRHRLRGARALLFYQLPQHPQFYAELLNLLEDGDASGEPPTGACWLGFVRVCRGRSRLLLGVTAACCLLPDPMPRRPPQPPAVTVLFSKVDALRLERVVGSGRSAKMLKSRKTGTFLFC